MTHWIWQQPKWPQFTWQESQLSAFIANARKQQGELIGAAKMLDGDLSLEAQAEILITDGINTSAIEGEKIALEGIRSSVARHLGLPTVGLAPPERAIEGLVTVLLDATCQYAMPLTTKRLCGWQAALFPTGYSNLTRIKTGALRGVETMRVVSGPIGREKIHFEAPPREGLEKQLQQFLHWFNNPPPQLDGLIRAGIAHFWFVTLHPFEDGNGRLARAITDMALAQDENSKIRLFSLSAQIMRNRAEYYAILQESSSDGLDITAWLHWFIVQIQGACELAEKTLSDVILKARFWLYHKNTPLNERQRKVINKMLNAGGAGFIGGMNTRKYMSLTKTSRATAYRELDELVHLGCLHREGSGRSVSYTLMTPQ